MGNQLPVIGWQVSYLSGTDFGKIQEAGSQDAHYHS